MSKRKIVIVSQSRSGTEIFDQTDSEARALENNDYFSFGDIQDRRDDIVKSFQDFQDKFGEFESLQSFLDLKSRFLDALPQEGVDNDIKKEINVTTPGTTNTLTLVYDLFESVDAEDDFIERNNIAHPACVPGGETYEAVDL